MTVELTTTNLVINTELNAVELTITPILTSGVPLPDGIVIDFDYVHTDNNFTNEDKQNLANQSGTNTGDQDLSGLQPKEDENLQTESKEIVGAINEINSVAKGANQALTFDNYQAVISAMGNEGLNSGQNLYVDTINVPDLWIKSVEISFVEYDYVSDEQFIADILAGVQIGYYKLALLETQKVDLTQYYTKSESDLRFAPTIHSHSVSDLSDVDGTATTVSTGDSFFMKVGNLWKTITESNFVTWLNTTFFTKTDSDRRFVSQNGGTIYHITRWFTPTSKLDIAANGLSATITSGQFTSAMTGAKLRLTGGVNEPIITYVNSNTINLSFAVDSSFFGQSVAVADWGIYERRVELNALKTDKIIPNSDTTGVVIRNAADGADVFKFDTSIGRFNATSLVLLNGEFFGSYQCTIYRDGLATFGNTKNSANSAVSIISKNIEAIRIASNQSVGFKTTTPETVVDVNGTTTLRDWVYLNNGTHTGDAVGDFRYKVLSGVLTFQKCDTANATRGSGNWVLVTTM